MQAQGPGRRYSSSWACLSILLREEGAIALMSGVVPRCCKVGGGQAVIFFTYEHLIDYLTWY
jgi:hypothetical protein